ncbi:hypothetical protein Fcan01_22337 [Folsomia candida]|uniref:Uncharacterized protein n=1 Tax=Folsomia candida TaxID=158441 RepID=A0A226DD70_FOLCA|nr:hypothetical protein Fcan01_22337 [Folsomia candida]
MLKFKNQQVKCSTRYELIPDGGRYQWDRLFSEHHIPPRCATSVIIVDPHIYKDYHFHSLAECIQAVLPNCKSKYCEFILRTCDKEEWEFDNCTTYYPSSLPTYLTFTELYKAIFAKCFDRPENKLLEGMEIDVQIGPSGSLHDRSITIIAPSDAKSKIFRFDLGRGLDIFLKCSCENVNSRRRNGIGNNCYNKISDKEYKRDTHPAEHYLDCRFNEPKDFSTVLDVHPTRRSQITCVTFEFPSKDLCQDGKKILSDHTLPTKPITLANANKMNELIVRFGEVSMF